MEVPPGSIQLTSDGLIYKHIEEEGERDKRYSNFNGTIVGVRYYISSPKGIVVNCMDSAQCWITGDKKQESELFLFLPVVVATMAVKEVCKVYFSKKYLVGDGSILGLHGQIDNSDYYEALVYLVDAEPMDYSPDQYKEDVKKYKETAFSPEAPVKTEPKPKPEKIVEKKEPKKEKTSFEIINEMIAEKRQAQEHETNQRKKFALNQLTIAHNLLKEKRIRNARSEFNRARMAWGPMVDLDSAPEDLNDEHLSWDMDKFKKYIESRALYGVALTFQAVEPPLTDKAINSLKESLTYDPEFKEATDLLKQLTGEDPTPVIEAKKEEEPEKIDYENNFPSYDDPSIQMPQFWVDEIPIKHRFGFAEAIKEKATQLFKSREYKNAYSYYNKMQIPFTTKVLKKLNPEEFQRAQYYVVVSKTNSVACYMELGKYAQAVVQSDYALDYIKKSKLDFDQFKAKVLYRKAKAQIMLNKPDDANETMKVLAEVPNANAYLNEVKRILKDHLETAKNEQEFLYKKMTGTL